ncbi:MAG: zinc-ribbon domain-containing protein [Pseudodesulfovibrio sp.]|nr:zinc-ribbon domain-containing protein [Pseudodesulfovibrio sp.]
MIVTCPNCQTRYNLPDDKIPAGGAKVKCSKCSHVFKAELPPTTPEEEVESLLEEESPATSAQAGDEFEETFDEVASGGDDAGALEEEIASEDEPEPSAQEPVEESPKDDDPGLDALFDSSDEDADSSDDDSAPDGEESVFGDDTGDLFDDSGDDDSEDASGLFEDDDDADDDDDDDEEDDDDLEEGQDDSLDLGDTPPKGSRKSLGCLIILLILALGIGAAIYFKVWTFANIELGSIVKNVPFVGQMFMEETGGDAEVPPGESPADRVRKIELKNVKQYYVANEKAGNLFVVEGKAVNKFAVPKEQIKVEVVLYDATGGVLVSQSFLCGNVLSQFQLQVQTLKEIEDGLSSEVGILSNNTFIRPGASTPFMAVFFQPPAGVKEFLVKVVDVGDPE